eukprot:scaffold105705_cov17-Tisochrysis_lutea.AAC.1
MLFSTTLIPSRLSRVANFKAAKKLPTASVFTAGIYIGMIAALCCCIGAASQLYAVKQVQGVVIVLYNHVSRGYLGLSRTPEENVECPTKKEQSCPFK